MSLVRQIVPSAAVGTIAEFACGETDLGIHRGDLGLGDVTGERPHPSVLIRQDTGEIDGNGDGSVGSRAPVALDVDAEHLACLQWLAGPRVEETLWDSPD